MTNTAHRPIRIGAIKKPSNCVITYNSHVKSTLPALTHQHVMRNQSCGIKNANMLEFLLTQALNFGNVFLDKPAINI